MMQCEKCVFYDAEYDRLFQSGDDCEIVGQEFEVKHYCAIIDNKIIPCEVAEDKKKCPFFVEKDKHH